MIICCFYCEGLLEALGTEEVCEWLRRNGASQQDSENVKSKLIMSCSCMDVPQWSGMMHTLVSQLVCG